MQEYMDGQQIQEVYRINHVYNRSLAACMVITVDQGNLWHYKLYKYLWKKCIRNLTIKRNLIATLFNATAVIIQLKYILNEQTYLTKFLHASKLYLSSQ